MRIAFGLNSIIFRRHHDYEELAAFLAGAGRSAWLGEEAETYNAFWSLEVAQEYASERTVIGVIVEHENALPQAAVAPDGSFLALGYNRCVAFFRGGSFPAARHELSAPFYSFVVTDLLILAIHELGCAAFSIANFNREWDRDTNDVVEKASLCGRTVVIGAADGTVRRLQLPSGAESELKE